MKKLFVDLLPWFVTFAFLTAFWIGLLSFMIADPDKWSEWIDRGYGFFVRRAILTPSFAEKCKRFEKGAGMKVLAVCGVLLGGAGLLGVGFVLVKFALFR